MSTKLFGVIIFSNEISGASIDSVRRAAAAAGLDADRIHEIKPRNTFIRAIRQLKALGVIEQGSANGLLLDKYKDDDKTIEFQFSRKFLESEGVSYDKDAVITFDKKSHVIECANPVIKEIAENLYGQIQKKFSGTDVQALVKRYIGLANAKRIPLRDGVYFISYQYNQLAGQIKKFYQELGFSYFILPVGDDSGQQTDVLKAVVNDIKRTIASMTQEITKLKSEDKLTTRIAKARLEELKAELKSYTELATALRANLKDLIAEAGDAGEVLHQIGIDGTDLFISSVLRSGKVSPLMYDLLSVTEPEVAARLPKPEPVKVDFVDDEQEEAAPTAQKLRKLARVDSGE